MAAQDLTTLANARSYLQKPTADTAQDPIISSLITRASVAIMRYAEREFAPATSSATRTFEYRGGAFLSLAPYDLRTLSQIRIDTDESNPSTLTSSEYRLYPVEASDGTYTSVRLEPYLAYSRARWQQRLVEVTGAWGFASVPADVEQWCLVTVGTWLKRDVSAFSTTFNLDESHMERPEALPAAVRGGLETYKRQAYA
jgi:hypothetical protein